ncbi:TetR/AcrR family transcriptional regulator [Pseudonocardia lutea]|uniref:TetR/AcrR family transcriptional regulator n=1 Tax=Pseudonocardia lutea TaxID=2172015 RepID=A0ABW1IBV5_9PSEU
MPHSTPGLRELKRRRTHELLIDTAVRLFLENGYAQTTVEQIAAEAEVSARTFFRYFASKDDVAMAPLDEVDAHFLRMVEARPEEETILEAFSAAIDASWGTDWSVPALARRLRLARLVQDEPALYAVNLRRGADHEDRLVVAVARRLGDGSDHVLRARLAVAALAAASRVALQEWLRRNDSPDADDVRSAVALFQRCLYEMVGALAPVNGRAAR